MKHHLTLAFLTISLLLAAQDDVFVIESSQSMVMTGKGPGQDGAINPYLGQECTAIVENLGKHKFNIRIQEKGRIKEEITVNTGEEKEIPLGKNDELYIDTDKKAKTRLNFQLVKQMTDSLEDLVYNLSSMMQRYTAYNYWADQQLADWLRSGSEEDLNREIESSFSSLKETVIHIWNAEYLWLQTVKNESSENSPASNFEGTKNDLLDGWLEASVNFRDHVQSMTLSELQTKRLRSSGDGYMVIADMIQHCMNHSTYHRGQLITMGRQSGLKDPPRTDFIYYVSLPIE
jgi:uncharacterized damage-inducible protein DinB